MAENTVTEKLDQLIQEHGLVAVQTELAKRDGGAIVRSDLKRSGMSTRDKSDFISNHGAEAFKKLPD